MRLGGRADRHKANTVIKLIQSLFATLGTPLKSVACEGYAKWPSQRIGVTRTAGQSGISRYTPAGPNSTKET